MEMNWDLGGNKLGFRWKLLGIQHRIRMEDTGLNTFGKNNLRLKTGFNSGKIMSRNHHRPIFQNPSQFLKIAKAPPYARQ